MGFLDGSDGKESAFSAEDPGLIPELGRSPGEGNGYPLQYSCLENFMDRGSWWSTAMGSKSVRHNLATNIFTFTGQENIVKKNSTSSSKILNTLLEKSSHIYVYIYSLPPEVIFNKHFQKQIRIFTPNLKKYIYILKRSYLRRIISNQDMPSLLRRDSS